MKTSNKLLTAVVVLAAAPLLCTSVAEYFRTAPLRELLGRIDRTPVRVVDARGLRLDADSLAGPTTPRLLLEGLPQAGDAPFSRLAAWLKKRFRLPMKLTRRSMTCVL